VFSASRRFALNLREVLYFPVFKDMTEVTCLPLSKSVKWILYAGLPATGTSTIKESGQSMNFGDSSVGRFCQAEETHVENG
jgi:hypothetical protein